MSRGWGLGIGGWELRNCALPYVSTPSYSPFPPTPYSLPPTPYFTDTPAAITSSVVRGLPGRPPYGVPGLIA